MKRRTFVALASTAAATGAGLPDVLGPANCTRAMKPIPRSGPAKMRLSVAAYSLRDKLPMYRNSADATGDLHMEDFIKLAAEKWPVDAVELTSYFLPHPTPDKRALELKRLAHTLGLDISGGAIGNNFSAAADSPELAKQMAYTEAWIKSYAKMGAPVIRVFAGKPAKGADQKEAVANIITNLQTACAIAGKHGVMLAMENHDFTTDIDRFLEIIEAVDSPWFGANLDSGNLARTDDPYRELARIAPYTVNAQIKVHIPVNGKKQPADMKRLVDLLRDAGYRGYLVLEYEDAENPLTAIPKHLDELANLL